MPYPSEPTFPTERARKHAPDLRAMSTPPEGVLWSRLRGRKLGGYKFRRQHPIGPFVADFYCDEAKLVVEIDSSYHNGRRQEDVARDVWMNEHSILVLRISTSQLTKNEEAVLHHILNTAQQLSKNRAIENKSN